MHEKHFPYEKANFKMFTSETSKFDSKILTFIKLTIVVYKITATLRNLKNT